MSVFYFLAVNMSQKHRVPCSGRRHPTTSRSLRTRPTAITRFRTDGVYLLPRPPRAESPHPPCLHGAREGRGIARSEFGCCSIR